MTICNHCSFKRLCKHTSEELEDCDRFDPIFDPVRQAVKTYGAEAQKWVLIGEIGELLDAIADHKRGRCGIEHIAEEITDVIICLRQLQEIYDCKGAVNCWLYKKLHRLAVNLSKEIQNNECEDQHA